jgi:hypothetical protein
MEYFGRNLFVMNILQAKACRKWLNTSDLRAGNGRGATPPANRHETGEEGNVQEREKGMVRPEGVEPPTYWFVASCSIQLSYGRTLRGDATL